MNPPFSRVLGFGWVLGNPTQTYTQITNAHCIAQQMIDVDEKIL